MNLPENMRLNAFLSIFFIDCMAYPDRVSRRIGIHNIVEIPQCGLYAKTPDSLNALLTYLKSHGYDVKDTRHEPRISGEDTPAGVREKNGWYLWYAHLNENTLQTKGECGSCGELISDIGIEVHGHQCEKCGEMTYTKFEKDSRVNFSFEGDQRFFSDLTLMVHSYDPKAKQLHFYANYFDVLGKPLSKGMEESYSRLQKELRLFPDAFTQETIGGADVISTFHDAESIYVSPNDKISIRDTFGGRRNFRIVKVFEGKRYDEFDSVPLPESYSIYETWHWAPLHPSPELHKKIIHAAGMVSRADYYYQDGRSAFDDIHLERMRLFVENFTTLNVKKWDKMIEKSPTDGPGMIRSIARFCHPKAVVENRPNIGNALVAMGKIMFGEPITPEELKEGERGLTEDPHGQRFVEDMIKGSEVKDLMDKADDSRN